MNKFEEIIKRLSRLFDRIAGLAVVALMLFVVINIIMRDFFGEPIMGAYEYVGLFAAGIIGLSLAFCSVQSGHIAISLITDKLHGKVQIIIDIITKTISMVFLGLFSWQMIEYAIRSAASGEVTPTTWTPIYPFIFIVALGMIALSLVVFVKLIINLRMVAKK